MELCSNCSSFDFKGLIDIPTPTQGDRNASEFQLGSIAEVPRRWQCSLCHLISRGITCYWPSAPRTEIILMSVHNEENYQYLEVRSNHGLDFEVDKAEPWKTPFAMKKMRQTTVALDLFPTHHTPRKKGVTSEHTLRNLDIEIPRRWLQRCETEHSENCGHASLASEDLPEGFMLIDVNTRYVIHAHRGARFFALSYVWGSASNQFRTSKKHLIPSNESKGTPKSLLQLPEKLPQVIQDALNFVRALGGTYLWVDALCIIHDDASHMKIQLDAMDRIYECAVLTIIAASGFSFSNHLPGYSEIPRSPLSIIGDIAGSELLIRFPPQHAAIDGLSRSPWLHRAWTYQEGLLSRRRLIFTNQEVFFICGTDFWSESRQDLLGDYKQLTVPWGLSDDEAWIAALFNNRSLESPVWQFKHYTSLVKGYLSRDITHTRDSLNAFRGLERRMQRSTGVKFFWGLPEGEDFHQALLWLIPDPQVSSPVRDGFPSWSWAGWFKGPYYVRVPGVVEEATIDEPPHVRGIGAKFWKETIDGKMDEVDTTMESRDMYRQPRIAPPQYKSHIYVESETANFDVRQVSEIEDPHLFSKGLDLGPVKFQRVSRRNVTQKIVNKSWEFLAVSENLMWLAERDARGFQWNMHRLVVGNNAGQDYGPFNIASRFIQDRKWSVYNTMMLEWQDGMVKCIAICQIKDKIWDTASPRRKVVKLG